MSTKIYNGIKIVGLSIKGVMNEFLDIQQSASNVAQDLTYAAIIKKAVLMYDEITLGKRDTVKNCISHVAMEIFKEQLEMEETKRRNPSVDFSFEVSIYPMTDNTFLGIYYTEHKALSDLLTSKSWCHEYAYYNNTDKPDNITAKEWEQRASDWSFIKYSTPVSQSMFSFIFHPDAYMYVPLKESDNIAFPSFEARIEFATLRDFAQQVDCKDYKTFLTNNRKGDYDVIKENLRNEYASKLHKDLTLGMLQNVDAKVQ